MSDFLRLSEIKQAVEDAKEAKDSDTKIAALERAVEAIAKLLEDQDSNSRHGSLSGGLF